MLPNTQFDLTGKADGWHWVRTVPKAAGTVLLIHALGLDTSSWEKQVEALSPDYNVVTVDLPMHGGSGHPPSEWDFVGMANDLTALVERLACTPVHVVGCSINGMIAQVMALTHPEAVCSLTLFSSAAAFPDELRQFLRDRAALVRREGMKAAMPMATTWLSPATQAAQPDLQHRIVTLLRADKPEAHVALCDLIANHDVLDRLGDIQCPTLIVVCETDTVTPSALSEAMAARIPDAQLTILEGEQGHLSPLVAPEKTTRLLTDFLARVSAMGVDRTRPV